MPKPISHTDDTCSYERRHKACSYRRHQLLAMSAGVWLACTGFVWPGRVPHLSYQAAHGSVAERVEALRLLEEYPSQASRDACLAGLEDRAPEVRTQAAQCVGAAGDERATTSLLDLAGSREPLERAASLEALGRLAPPRALAEIEQALGDAAPAVRVAAVRALGAYVQSGAFELAKLAPLLSSEIVEVRLTAVEVLAATGASVHGAHPAVPARIVLLRAAARDQAAEVRAAALRAMGSTRDAKLLPDLTAGVSDRDEVVRLSAIAALGDSNLASATSPLRALTANTSQLRAARTALAALGRIDDASALAPLATALTRQELTRSAAQALVARARRLNNAKNAKQSAEALERAIEATTSPTAISVTPDALVAPRSPLAAAAAPATNTGASAARPNNSAATRADSTSASAARGSIASGDAGGSLDAAAAALDALAQAVVDLAALTDVSGAASNLLRALERGRGEGSSLTGRLLALAANEQVGADKNVTRSSQIFAALLKRDVASSPRLAEAVVTVLRASPDARELVAAHDEPLRRIADAQQASAPQLHALLHVAQTDTSLDARRALAQLWAAQPVLAASPAPRDKLLAWLDDADPEVREHSSVALAGAADATTLQALSARLERAAPHPELTLQACAGTMLRMSTQLPTALRERLLQQLQTYLNKPDETVALSALLALRAANDQRSAPWIAGLLRGSSQQLRAAAIQSLAGFDQPEARRMLRDMLRGDNVHNASNAALALAELGSDRDVEALLRAAERGSWPLPPAAAYAAARITARGATRKHSLERVLCRFAQLRDTYVLSNIVSALASLGADACDPQIEPRNLLDPKLPSALRVSAALWLQSTRPHSPQETSERNARLAQCANDQDSAVATACSPNAITHVSTGQTLIRALAQDAHSPLPQRVVALRQPDGSVFVAQTSNTGLMLLPRAASGLRAEDPADHGALALPQHTRPTSP